MKKETEIKYKFKLSVQMTKSINQFGKLCNSHICSRLGSSYFINYEPDHLLPLHFMIFLHEIHISISKTG